MILELKNKIKELKASRNTRPPKRSNATKDISKHKHC